MMQRRVSCKLFTFILHLLLAGLSSPTIEAGNFLIPEQPLYDNGTTLISSGGRFELGFFSPAGSSRRYIGIWYRNISQRIVWVANRSSPIHNRSGRFSLSGEGSLVIATDNSTFFRSSITATGLANPEATLFDDGNFAVREAGNDDLDSFAWQSFDFPTDTLLPGMKLGWDLASSLNRQLTSWASADDPSPGNQTLGIELQINPQLFLRSGTQQLWRGGPWNGLHFSGAPDMDDPILFKGRFVVDPHQVIYSFGLRDPSTISVLVMGQTGILQRLVWNGGRGAWEISWYIPHDQCDVMSACGANAVCNPNSVQSCTCLAGFLVNNLLGWDPTSPSYGCSRRSPWKCGNGADEFRRIAGSKLPDTSTSVVDRRLNLNECRESCVSNCYCTAFASSNVGENASGCIMWIGDIADLRLYNDTEQGQDLYVRAGAFDHTDGSSNQSFGRSHLALAIVVPALAIFLLVFCIACYFCRRRRRLRKRKNCVVVKEIEEKDLDLPLFDLVTVLDATSNFAAENKLGQGGFGPVHKGKLVDGREIAVKRLSKTSTQGIHEFKNEVVIIAKLQHQNLVRLLGCCIQGGERMLIYEYMPNGSLDAFLFDEAKRVLLDWKTRYNIIVGIARGLLYLHHDSRLKIIHRDLKTSNILLDKGNIPKISDFGLARIFRGDEMEINTRRIVGTYGYMSPEYAMNGFFSIKSDVFSFGVLILEIISGKKNREVYNSNYLNLLGHIWSLWKEDKSLEIIDESICHSFSAVEVMRCIKIGLLCVQERPQDRPTMPLVVVMLGSDGPIPEPKQPGFLAALDSSDSAIRKQYLLSINDVSNTTLEGR